MVDGVVWARYPQKLENTGFFSNVTTVLTLSGLVGGDMGPIRGPGNHALIGQWAGDRSNAKTAA